MPKILQASEFLEKAKTTVVIDVRTPAEYEAGHIPCAYNIPLFSNEERATVGTIYVKKSKEEAILKGLEFVGPKLALFVKQANELSVKKEILVHCWRGGMRSGSLAWLLELSGYRVSTLLGGYKSYRSFIRKEFDKPQKMLILGGMTGSGKTEILHKLKEHGEQIIDLEAIVHHKGSAFGSLGEEKQPSTEHCENLIYAKFEELDYSKIVWIEDESQRIGDINLNDVLYNKIRNSPVVNLNVEKNIRVKRLVQDYGNFSKAELSDAILRIKKRLGGLETQQCLQGIEENNLELTAGIALRYYDKTYNHGLCKRNPDSIYTIDIQENNPENTATKLIEISRKIPF